MAEKAEQVGVRKARMDAPRLFALAVLAGAFIALGGAFSTTAMAGSTLPYGITRLVGGVVFSLGLILVIVGGAELFTGNTLIVMAWAGRKVRTVEVLRNWTIVYLGNFVGAVGTAALVFLSGQYRMGNGVAGASALAIADIKCGLEFMPAVALGVLCNALVCLAVWMSFGARSVADKVLVIVPPIAGFVALGFEHSVANMYFVPLALMVQHLAPPEFWMSAGKTGGDYPHLNWLAFFTNNLLPVTLGNILGGSVLVGTMYWFIYLRGRKPDKQP
ncbi:MAG: formate transporter FocA [Planctomycetes bacterium]|nr:formate transporter FocA [Planctomycetota bacterium]